MSTLKDGEPYSGSGSRPTVSEMNTWKLQTKRDRSDALRGAMGEISNFYNFLPRMLIFGTHMPPAVTMLAAKFH